MKDKTIEAASYAGSITSIVSGLTLTDIGVIIGIITALLTFAVNVIYRFKKMRQEESEHEMRMGILRSEQRHIDLGHEPERRHERFRYSEDDE